MRIILILSLLLISLVGQSQTVVVNYIERKIISKEKLETIPEFARNQALASYAYVLYHLNFEFTGIIIIFGLCQKR